MTFDPSASSIKCPYCGHANPIPQSEEDIEELDFHEYLSRSAQQADTEQATAVRCESCGAETTLDANVSADECPFCGSAVLGERHDTTRIKPRSLLPFQVSREQAVEAFGGWIAGLWFAPNKLKEYARAETSRLSGVYVPYWTYDADCTSYYRGERGDEYWVTESYTTTENGKSVRKTRRVRKIRWTPVSGTVFNRFDDVLVLASRSLPTKYAERLEPWDLENLAPYDGSYLAGFRAETYQVDLAEGFGVARGIMDGHIRSAVRRDIGGDEQRIHSVRTRHDNVTFKHLLLPVWISAYRYRDKVYRFLVNARTGEVQGERPWSWWKIALAGLAGLLVAALIIALIVRFQG
jgi:predicted RNA-binding Zn-ribbon protein involved in translation (DUF1610 family)